MNIPFPNLIIEQEKIRIFIIADVVECLKYVVHLFFNNNLDLPGGSRSANGFD